MFLGHAFLAFALVAGLARWRGWDRDQALRVGALAALFATAPDLDVLYGPVGLLGGVSGVFDAAESFWATGNVVHRGPTHSLLVGAAAATAFACWRVGTVRARTVAAALLVGVAAVVGVVSGFLGAAVTALFLLGGLVVVRLAAGWDVSPRTVGLAAAAGLLTHPFGDLLTGTPPALLYPFDATLLGARIALHPDPTVHLLGAFGVELLTAWAALVVAFHLMGRSVRAHVDRRAALGVGYAGAALALPAPTLETSYHFVFSVLALGAVGVSPRRVRRTDARRAGCTGLAAVTAAAFAYGVAYLLL